MVPFINTSDPCKLICMLPGQQPVDKGTAVDGTLCLSDSICIDGTCVVSYFKPPCITTYTSCNIISLWDVMGFLDQKKKLMSVEGVVLQMGFVYMFHVWLIMSLTQMVS